MTETHLCEIEKRLSNIPEGGLLLKKHDAGERTPVTEEIVPALDGKGLVERWEVFSGIALVCQAYRASRCGPLHAPLGPVLRADHCRFGQIRWEAHGGAGIRLGPGELCLHTADARSEPVTDFPTGYYEGIAVLMDLDVLAQEPPELPRQAGVDPKRLSQKLCGPDGFAVMPAGPRLDHIFSPLYTLPPHLKLPYFKLKAQELLLFLSALEPETSAGPYPSQQVQTIRAIHRQLTEHLDRRYTIEALSRQYLINTSTLKAVFKRVYGAPVASYMREYRVRRAAGLLRETRDSVAEIAAQVGYKNQSKFTAAFQEIMGTPPTAYRKR